MYLSYLDWQHDVADRIRFTNHRTTRMLMAEFFGTMVFAVFSIGIGAQTYLSLGVFGKMLEQSVMIAGAYTLGLFIAGPESTGFLNPTISLCNTLLGRLRFTQMLLHWLFQMLGCFIGALIVMAVYYDLIWEFTLKYDFGVLNMTTTGQIFANRSNATLFYCFVDQLVVGIVYVVCVMGVLDKNNWKMSKSVTILYLAVIEFLIANDFSANSSSLINPALDFGPRMALLMTGWGSAAFTDTDYVFTVYLFCPILCALIGVFLYEVVIGIHLPNAGEDSNNYE